MEINDIKIFFEVANLKSTIKTANKMGYVQSNISKRIAKLEVELGKKLFQRTNKGMTLTNDGEIFLTYAEKILLNISDMEDYFSIHQNHLRIGATQSISKNYLQNSYFNKNISIFTNSTNELVQNLKDCNIDFMIVNREISDIELKEVKTLKENIYWAKAKENQCDFLENKIIISRDTNCPYRIKTLEYLKENKIVDTNVIEVDTIDILTSILEKNEAVAILPEKSIASNDKLKSFENLINDDITIYIYTQRNNNVQFEVEIL